MAVTGHSFGKRGTEVRSIHRSGHVVHVFANGPAWEGGRRYVINPVALRFVQYRELEVEEHGRFTELFEDSATEGTGQWQR